MTIAEFLKVAGIRLNSSNQIVWWGERYTKRTIPAEDCPEIAEMLGWGIRPQMTKAERKMLEHVIHGRVRRALYSKARLHEPGKEPRTAEAMFDRLRRLRLVETPHNMHRAQTVVLTPWGKRVAGMYNMEVPE